MKISAQPLVGGLVRHGRASGAAYPLRDPRAVTCWNGRAAIWQGMRRLGLPDGARVLLPAYCCGSEHDAVVKAGFTVEFYPLTPSLTPDLERLRAMCRVRPSARVLYVIHYCGFAQPMDDLLAFAAEHDLKLVEDCAQALYSADEAGRPLGSRGDLGVFSFVKTLPLPDGGAYVAGPSDLPRPAAETVTPDPLRVAGKLKFLCEEAAAARYPEATRWVVDHVLSPATATAKRLTGRGAPPASAGSAAAAGSRSTDMAMISLDPPRGRWRMSGPARMLMRRVDHHRIVETRRRNFTALAGALRSFDGVRALFDRLPDGCCPLLFPLHVRESTALHRFLGAEGVGCKRLWSYFHDAMPAADFPFESDLKRSVVALPIHQDLGPAHMARIADTVNRWGAKQIARSAVAEANV